MSSLTLVTCRIGRYAYDRKPGIANGPIVTEPSDPVTPQAVSPAASTRVRAPSTPWATSTLALGRTSRPIQQIDVGVSPLGSHPSSTGQVLGEPTLASPVSDPLEAHRPVEGIRDPHLSGHEPRYIPGMMTRAQRKNSLRHGSNHESDEGNYSRSVTKSD